NRYEPARRLYLPGHWDQPAEWPQQVRHPLREGCATASQRVLVGDGLRFAGVHCTESDQPLHARGSKQPETKCRRITGHLPPERESGRGQRGELATDASPTVLPPRAAVLATEGCNRRHLGYATCRKGALSGH